MKRIAYAEEWLTTDDLVADLVLEYARSLARVGTADTVTIPVLESEAVRQAQLLIGPASQIIVVETDDERPELFDTTEAVAELRSLLDRLRAPSSVLYDSGEDLPEERPED